MDRNSKDGRLKGMICSLCVILIIFGCAEKQNRYGINFNDQRSIIKLPLLDSSWKYSPSYTSEGGTWVNPQKRDGVPCYFQKRNLIKNNRIIWESDIYLGGKTYMTIDGSIRESLTVTYYFERNGNTSIIQLKEITIVVIVLLKLKIYIIALISCYQSVKRILYSSLGIYD